VALNTAITGLKKQLRKPAIVPWSEDFASQAEENTQEIYLKAMRDAVNELSAVEKALVMLFFEDYSYQEIGEVLGISANHVAVKMNRIKTKLKETTKKFI
jgi:RNA polymerase sigma-70 factor (ECF subfamily)